ncbi:MAG TPA: hypothetical protein VGQ51_11110 [Puia sp.]|nr:hypothetical protein [Puia sp.]
MNLSGVTRTSVRQEKPVVIEPSAAIVLPFNPKMTPRHELEALVQSLQSAAEKQLLGAHSSGQAMPVIRRLQQLFRGLNFSTHKRSVALFASAETAKTIYLDAKVDTRLIIDQPFRVRDLADCKPDGKEYLLLLLSGKQSKMYVSDASGLRLIKSNTPQHLYAYLNEVPEKTGNFCDRNDRHEIMLNKFLHHMDEGLGAVLKAYPLPVFVAATERVGGHFRQLTRHDRNIAGYLYKHCIDASERDLQELLHPMLDNWGQVTSQLLLLQMEKAAEAGKLVVGIEEVRKAARCSNSRIVIIEKEYADTASFYKQDPIDEVVEKVLENGGEIEKLDKNSLAKYGPIALIRYY